MPPHPTTSTRLAIAALSLVACRPNALPMSDADTTPPQPAAPLVRDGALVHDPRQGLVWRRRDSLVAVAAADAQAFCDGLGGGPLGPWRLPTGHELAAAEVSAANGPFTLGSTHLWTAPLDARGVQAFDRASRAVVLAPDATYPVLCVSGPAGPAEPAPVSSAPTTDPAERYVRLSYGDEWFAWDRGAQRLVEIHTFPALHHSMTNVPAMIAWVDARARLQVAGDQRILGYRYLGGDAAEHPAASSDVDPLRDWSPIDFDVIKEPAVGLDADDILHSERAPLIRSRWASLWRQVAVLAADLGDAFRPLTGFPYAHLLLGIDGKLVLRNPEAGAGYANFPPTKTIEPRVTSWATSPGDMRKGTPSPRDAVFMLGSVLYFFATGVDPFGKPDWPRTTNVLAIALGTAPTPPLPSTLTAVPPGFDALVMRALAPRPEDRFADPRALIAAADEIFDGRTPVPLALEEALALDAQGVGRDAFGAAPALAALLAPFRLHGAPECWLWADAPATAGARLARHAGLVTRLLEPR